MIPIDEVVTFSVTTRGASGAADADSAPTFNVFEESTDTAILADQTMTKRTGHTGVYRGTFTASAANGFEAGKWYDVVCTGIVGGVTDKTVALTFRIAPAESVAGVPKVDLSHWLGSAPNALVSSRVDVSVGAMAANVLTATAIQNDAITAAKVAADQDTATATAVWASAARTLTAATNITSTGGTITVTSGGVHLADGAHGGTAAVITFNRMRGISTDLDQPCIHIDGNGTGAGLECHGGSDGPGIFAWTPAEGRFGIHAKGPGGGMWTEADVNALNEGIGWYSSAKESGGAYGFYAHGALAGLIASGTTGSSASGFQAAGGSLGGHAVLLLRGGAGADDLHLANSDAPTLRAAILTAGAIDATVAPNLDAAVSTRASQTSVDDLPTNSELATALDPIPTANENADALIGRNIAGGSSTGRTVGQALAAQRNKVAFDVPVAGQFTVYATDDVTPLWTGTYTTAAGNPVTAIDPV